MTVSVTTLGLTPMSIMTFGIMRFSKTTLRIMTLCPNASSIINIMLSVEIYPSY